MFLEETQHIVKVAVSSLSLLAQDGDAPETTPFSALFNSPWPLILGVFFLFYFIVLLPEKRRKAEETKRMSLLKKNDRVVTIGGIHGTVVSTATDNKIVTIRVDDNTRIKINRTAIAQILSDKESQDGKNKETASDTKDT